MVKNSGSKNSDTRSAQSTSSGSSPATNAKASGSSIAFPVVARILRTVPDENAFYFHSAPEVYLGVRARSLAEFLEQVRTIDIASVEFHFKRGDFANWFGSTLGDDELVGELNVLPRTKKGEDLRGSISRVVSARLAKLQKLH